MKKRLFCFLMAVLVLLVSCSGGNEKPPIDSSGTDSDQTNEPMEEDMQIVVNRKSDFVITVDYADRTAVAFAEYLQNEIAVRTGVLIPKRPTGQVGAEVKRIFVRSGVNSVPENGFAVSIGQAGLELSANDFLGYYRMEQFCSGSLFAGAKPGEWSVSMADIEDSGIADDTVSVSKNGTDTWYLVYNADDPDMRPIANGVAAYLMSQCSIKIKPASDDKTYEREIRLGAVARKSSQTVAKYMTGETDTFFGVLDGSYTILFNHRLGLAFGVLDLISKLNTSSNQTVELKSSESGCFALSLLPKNDIYAEAVSIANTVCGTFSTWVDQTVDKMGDVKKDQALVKALIERMDDAFAVSVGSARVLWQGYIRKADRDDDSRVTRQSAEGHILIPSDFATRYFGKTLPADAEGYVDLTVYCRRSGAYTLDVDAERGIAVVSPAGAERFDVPEKTVNGYSNAVYLTRMAEFFGDTRIPDSDWNVEASRTVVDSLDFETRYIFDYTTHSYQTFYSPAILIRQENGTSVLYVAYEVSTVLGGKEMGTATYLKRSHDGGESWEAVGEVSELRWASLFEHDGKLWLLGNHRESGSALISSFDPTGQKWKTSDIGMKKAGGGAPNTVAIANGRIYKAMNNGVISARADSDLTVGANWTVSNDPQELISRETFDRLAGEKSNPNNIFRFEEGNVVVAPDGDVCILYRVDAAPTVGHVALFRLSADGKVLTVDEETGGIIDFPYSQSKFSVRYDAATGLYISLTSLSTMNHVLQRNVLGLVVSKDLIHWDVVGTLLSDREMMNPTVSMYAHAFQYVDFVLDGTDLLFVVREAVGDTIRFHDANNVTVYRLKNYRLIVESRQSEGVAK